jgi:transposase InsO family protein
MALDEGFTIKAYHSDNGVFAAADFKAHCERKRQIPSFSGVGAKHQNGFSERNIKTVAQWAHANMLHMATHCWPAAANTKYWPQAIDYTVWVFIFNRLPN